ncbi:MAG TPA: tetratricopeptide repeat protein [Candidatus Hydrogenedentes bacterium]|nr:tetratricopeptide repeat protein [Candidatus Hydrogenedentota bacterium]HPG67328.1 tetratricopeptide repeat protein [Candidatus Hydrogenedentota bacterium]
MSGLKREQVAWGLLMLSFLTLTAGAIWFRHPVASYLSSHARPALMARAGTLEQQNNAEEAERVYQILFKRYDRREDVLLAYAGYLERRNRYDEAEAMYARAASVGRQQFSGVRRYASFLDRQARSGEAITAYEAYVAKYPDDYAAQFDLGLRLFAIAQYESCVRHLEAAAQGPAFRVEAEALLGRARLRQGEPLKAIAAWNTALAAGNGPEAKLLWQDIAAVHESLGEWNSAIEAWRAYLECFPEAVDAAERLRAVYARIGDEAQVARMTLRVDALAPPRRIERSVSERLALCGSSAAPDGCAPGECLHVSLWLRVVGDVPAGRDLTVRFFLRPAGLTQTADAQLLTSEPPSLAPAPFWRGDTVRRRFAAVIPADAAPGAYQLDMAVGGEDAAHVMLWPLTVSGGGP